MTEYSPLKVIAGRYRETNDHILEVVGEVSDSQFRWRPNSSCHSIAFILWHLARWADYLQAFIPGMTEELARRLPPGEQIWHRERMAAKWDLNAAGLGYEETGTDAILDDEPEPDWPSKEIALNYARDAFSAAERAVDIIDKEQFVALERLQVADEIMEASRARSVTVGNAVMDHLVHNIQHLGEVYYLRGLIRHSETHQ